MAGRPRNERARRDILRRAADVASAHGLDGLTIGRLASDLGLSKSGLFGYFGSKEDLQIATIRRATEVYVEEVIDPAFREPPGLPRLVALCSRWLRYSQRRVFPGGCFFFAVMAEFDAQSGAVHDTVADASRTWNAMIEHQIARAVELGELRPDAAPEQLAFELIAVLEAANAMSVLHRESKFYENARHAVRSWLEGAGAPAEALEPLSTEQR